MCGDRLCETPTPAVGRSETPRCLWPVKLYLSATLTTEEIPENFHRSNYRYTCYSLQKLSLLKTRFHCVIIISITIPRKQKHIHEQRVKEHRTESFDLTIQQHSFRCVIYAAEKIYFFHFSISHALVVYSDCT